ncbi:DUF1849 family protein [Aureimonas sp. ME7]|uniref:EipB family protein n=1 Tax=Aureimonas sp. ME7 TaxID=2744252 RepID=UPI0015F66CAD|nr:DUF1849 family protein [Aureimonas sp. ME7]
MKHFALPLVALMPIAFDAAPAKAFDLQPHEAVYDLELATQTQNFSQVEGRIALQLKPDTCSGFVLDYRFLARFHEEDELTVTDQQTLAKETRDGKRYEFRTRTIVDGTEQGVVEGTASNEGAQTSVTYTSPVQRETTLPLSVFPLGHTAQLAERAKAGDRVVQSKLFDGDDEAEKQLTTTAVLFPAKAEDVPAKPEIATLVEGLRAWNVTESYFNDDSNDDGMPIFETRYRLYENGVSDKLYLDFGDYTLKGDLSRLQYYDPAADCAATP